MKILRTVIIAELRGKYFVAKRTAKAWLEEDALTLLLDGLDEVQEDNRSACIEWLSIYLGMTMALFIL